MAKATAACRCAICGKTFEKIAYKANRKEADAWEAWAAEHLDKCKECWQAEKQAKDDAVNETLEPITDGSEKQVAWAVKIRLNAKRRLETIGRGFVKEDWEPFMDFVLNSHPDARWWIDNRFYIDTLDVLSLKPGQWLANLAADFMAIKEA